MQPMLKEKNNQSLKGRKMMEIGRVCIKTAGRDSGKRGVIIDVINESYVAIDGQVRRKKCNIKHLEPSETLIAISKNAAHEEVIGELKKLGIEVKEKSKKEKKVALKS